MAAEAQGSVTLLVDLLVHGLAAWSLEFHALSIQQKQVESKLSWAKQQYLDLLKRSAPHTFSHDHLIFLQELEQVGDEPLGTTQDWIEQIAQSNDAERRSRAVAIRAAEEAAKTHKLNAQPGVKIWSGPLADREHISLQAHMSDARSIIERDFTIYGTPSKLACPFACESRRGSLATPRSSISRPSLRGRRSKRPSFTDPIRAEICGNDHASAPASAGPSGSAAGCPIRFLNEHGPEEVARFFEKHKHELPRSHELCITRFQSSQESIERLDRKYGSLVNMIQGLGQKHQAWLPEQPEEMVEEEPEARMVEDIKDTNLDIKVRKWATAVSTSLQGDNAMQEDELQDHEAGEARTAHFDRPLKEVRLGESPSRPWGIVVSTRCNKKGTSSSVGSAPTASPQLHSDIRRAVSQVSPRQKKCPLDRQALGDLFQQQHDVEPVPQSHPPNAPRSVQGPDPESQPQAKATKPTIKEEAPKAIPQMIFNGPVFLGYPPDQLLGILKSSNLEARLAMS